MSRLSDYSKFDNLKVDDDDDDDDDYNHGGIDTNTAASSSLSSPLSSSSVVGVPIHEIVPTNTSLPQQEQHQQHQAQSPTIGATLRLKGGSINNNKQQQLRSTFIFEYNGQPIYEWEQGLSEVIISVYCPPISSLQQQRQQRAYRSTDFDCSIKPLSIQIGLKGSKQYFIDELTYEKIDVNESTWTIEEEDDDVVDGSGSSSSNSNSNTAHSIKRQLIVLYLQKVAKGIVWKSALKGHRQQQQQQQQQGTFTAELDPISFQSVQQQLLKERWQEENPGLDFSDATFNGAAPDPRSYMGGVRYD